MGDNRKPRGFLVLRDEKPCSYSRTDDRCYWSDVVYVFDSHEDARLAVLNSDRGEHWQIVRLVGGTP